MVKVEILSKTVLFPKVCPRCLSPADDKIKLTHQKFYLIFRTIHTIEVPFCRNCVNEWRKKRNKSLMYIFILFSLWFLSIMSVNFRLFYFLTVVFIVGLVLLTIDMKKFLGISFKSKFGNKIEFNIKNPEYAKLLRELNTRKANTD